MNTALFAPSRTARIALLALAGLIAGCASGGAESGAPGDSAGPVGVWTPHARARFVTISRSTTYTIVREEHGDLLVLEEGIDGAPADGPDRFVWIVSIPNDAPFGLPIEFGGDEPGAWLLEYRAGESTNTQRASGRVTVLGRTADSLSAQIDLSAPGRPLGPGQLSADYIGLAARLDLPRYQPLVPTTDAPMTRSGTDGLRDPNPEPRSVYGTR